MKKLLIVLFSGVLAAPLGLVWATPVTNSTGLAAPVSTIDPATPTGADIPIETRAADELLGCMGGGRIAADGAGAWNPVFDVTPAALVDAIVTERGVIERPDAAAIAAHLALPDPLVGARL